MVGVERLELPTPRTQNACATNCATPRQIVTFGYCITLVIFLKMFLSLQISPQQQKHFTLFATICQLLFLKFLFLINPQVIIISCLSIKGFCVVYNNYPISHCLHKFVVVRGEKYRAFKVNHSLV